MKKCLGVMVIENGVGGDGSDCGGGDDDSKVMTF